MTTKTEMDSWKQSAALVLNTHKNAIIAPAAREYILTTAIADDAEAGEYREACIRLLARYESKTTTVTEIHGNLASQETSLRGLVSLLSATAE